MQKYPDFEVVVVNHASDDESLDYLKEMQGIYPHLKVVNIERDLNFFKGKKFPLSMGIKSAKNDILLLTDADCEPASENWISGMVRNYRNENIEVVLGYGPYKKESGLTNKIVRYDTFLVAMQYLSFALAGYPYMGVGRNLSYRRSLFFRNKGFTSHYTIASGDDDLFINKVAVKKNTAIEISHETFMYSQAKQGFGEWVTQKLRHLSTGKYYGLKIKTLLGLYSFSQLIFYTSLIVLLVLWVFPWYLLGAFLFRFYSQFVVHKFVLKRLNDGGILLFSLVWEIIHLIILFFITFMSVFRKNRTWK
ncbi:MAG: glycosyltransferase [Chlorobi bacterium]|nr:glycosyltransferase [Chlorobiota bacterium]